MPVYELTKDAILALPEANFSALAVRERSNLQRLLRDHIEVISPETLVIAEEFGDWEDSRRRIDLLGIDTNANLVVIELKRDDAAHMELQAIRYASMISSMTFEQAEAAFGRYLRQTARPAEDPRAILLEFLGWETVDEDKFGHDVRIVLASTEFSKELTSSVLWLIDHDINIKCVRMRPYLLEGRVLVDVQPIIPLPELAEYQVQVREKSRQERQARSGGPDFTRYDVKIGDQMNTAMWKRNAIFLVAKHLCDQGIDPDEIARLIDWRPNRVWYFVDGAVNSEQFQTLAFEKANEAGGGFSRGRWHIDDDDLVRANGRTYAFSNQWGGPNWHRAMDVLAKAYPQFRISYAPTA